MYLYFYINAIINEYTWDTNLLPIYLALGCKAMSQQRTVITLSDSRNATLQPDV